LKEILVRGLRTTAFKYYYQMMLDVMKMVKIKKEKHRETERLRDRKREKKKKNNCIQILLSNDVGWKKW